MKTRSSVVAWAIVAFVVVIGVAGYGLSIGSSRSAAGIVALDPGPLRAAYLVPDATAIRTTVYLVVQAGEIDAVGTEGLAHYTEHLAWMTAVGPRGAPDRHSNAWTTQLATVYWLASANAPEAIAASLARVLGPIALPQDFMVEERGIVARERDFRVGATSSDRMTIDDAMTDFLHADDPRKRSVLGSAAQIASFRPEDAMALHDRLYRPERCVVVVVGDLSPAAAGELVGDAFGSLAPGDGAVPILAYATAPDDRDAQSVVLGDASRGELHYAKVVTLPEPQAPAQLLVALDFLYAILDSRLPGSLAAPLRYDAQLAQGYDLSLSVLDGANVELNFDADADRGVTAKDLLAAFEGTLSVIAASGVPEETFDRVHERAVRDLAGVDDPTAFTLDRALALIQMRQPPEGHAETLARLRGLEPADMDLLLTAIAGPGRVSARTVEP